MSNKPTRFATRIAVNYAGDAMLIDKVPDELSDFMDGPFCADNGWKNCPTDPGSYLVDVEFRVLCDGVSRCGEPADFDCEFRITKAVTT